MYTEISRSKSDKINIILSQHDDKMDVELNLLNE